MYQAIGVKKLLTLFALLAGVVIAIKAALAPPDSLMAWWSTVTLGASVSSGAFFLFGQTPAFAYLCKRTPLGIFAPPISGDWNAQLDSNWPEIAHRSGIEVRSTAPTLAKVKVIARLLYVKILLDSESKYSNSKTVAVRVSRDEESGSVRIHYIYENSTPIPEKTDSAHHFGAAYLDVEGAGNSMRIVGLYWTNRNWTQALNTAGKVTWTR